MATETAIGKRYALLHCAEDCDFVKRRYGGYFGVFMRLLAEEGESWKMYRAADGELPGDDEIEIYDGFVITGSCTDAHGDDLWVLRLVDLLKKLDSLKKKILGICFGHQILSRALGGKVSRSKLGWDIGVTNINFSPATSKLFASLKIPNKLSVIECHRDEVVELPAGAEIMAWSDRTGIEMFRCGSHIMGIQGHPEYTKDVLDNLIGRLLQRRYIDECHASEVRSNVEKLEPDRDEWKKICLGFLKSRL